MARDIAKTEAYVTSRRERKKIEMLFAHLKRILKLDRLRLRGPNGARGEFHLAATAQNLRKLAKLIPMPEPRACCYLAESGFPNGIGYDSSFLLEWGASMDDATLFRGSSGTSSDAVGCRRYGSGDRGGAIDQPVVLVEMAQAAA
jgi:hypothetical protein